MRVRMLQSMVGPRTNRRVGDEIDMNDAEAVRCINAGFAEMIRPPGATETKAAPKPAEHRTTKKTTKKKATKRT